MLRNPLEILADLYRFLRLEPHRESSPTEEIWGDDQILLDRGLEFYRGVRERLGQPQISWNELGDLLKQPQAPERFNPKGHLQLWEQIRASHQGFQLGMELLSLPLAIGREVNYFGFRGNERLEIDIPREFTQPESVEELIAELIPVSENRLL